MQLIIIAAGMGSRFLELTKENPKVLLKIHGITILNKNILSFEKYVEKINIVVGFEKDKIIDSVKNISSKKINFYFQDILDGPGGALETACKQMDPHEKIIIINGDNIYSKKIIKKCIYSENSFFLSFINKKTKNHTLIKDNTVIGHINGRDNGNLISIGLYNTYVKNVNQKIINFNNEKSIPHSFAKQKNFTPFIVPQNTWLSINNIDEYNFAKLKFKNAQKLKKY